MIVGVKKRSNSKDIFDLGVLQEIRTRTYLVMDYTSKEVVKSKDFYGSDALVILFDKLHRKWSDSKYFWTKENRIIKICDNILPEECNNSDCKYRFKCMTSFVGEDK